MCVLYEFISARHMLRTCVYTLHSTHIATQLYAAISIDQNVKERVIVCVCAHINVCISSSEKKSTHTNTHTHMPMPIYANVYSVQCTHTQTFTHNANNNTLTFTLAYRQRAKKNKYFQLLAAINSKKSCQENFYILKFVFSSFSVQFVSHSLWFANQGRTKTKEEKNINNKSKNSR